MTIEVSLGFFSIFNTATPSLISIIIYFCTKKLQNKPSNIILFLLGLLFDILFGVDLGLTSIFLLLMKFFTARILIESFNKDSEQDWIYFTIIFILSFSLVFLLNIILNFSIPDLSPLLFHVGITLILFPFISVGIDFINFITRIIKTN